jgi:putative ABC transport system permease protein
MSAPVLARLYRALLRGYPRTLRDRYGEEMARVFEAGAKDARLRGGLAGLLWFCAGALGDVVRGVISERLRASAAGLRERQVGEEWPVETSIERMHPLEGLWRDVRHGVRSLRRSPAFTVAAVLTMGLGIGANAAIFSVVRAVLLRPLPYEDADRLVMLWGEMTQRNVSNFPWSPPDYLDFRDQTTQLEDVAAVITFAQPLTGDGEPVQVQAGGVTTNFLSVLGVRPALGRDFVTADGEFVEQPAGAPAANAMVILSDVLWRTRYGGDPSVIGRVIDMGGNPGEIVGVAPPDFALHMPAVAGLASTVDLWTALRLDFVNANRNNVFLRVVARLAPGATLASAQQDVSRIAADLRARFVIKETSGLQARLVPLHADLVAPVRPVLLALMGAVVLVLLIACANVANLLLIRSVERERELAVRRALGGSRSRLVRQTLVDSALLSAAGGALGLFLASLGVSAVRFLRPAQLPRITEIELDGTVLAFTAGAAIFSAALFGLVPALRASRPAVTQVLRASGRAPGLALNRVFRDTVIIAEVALSLVLMIGAGLMMRTFSALQRVDHGFDAAGVLTFNVSLGNRFPSPEARRAFRDGFESRLRALPQVTAVASGLPVPLDGTLFHGRWGLAEALTNPQAFRQANYRVVSDGYFEALGITLVEGRVFTRAEIQDSMPVVVVDELMAASAFPGRSAVGERILVRISTPEPVWVEIVGVVKRQRHESPAEPGRENIFFTDRYAGLEGNLTWFVRTAGDPLGLVAGVRQALAAIEPTLPVSDVRPLASFVAQAIAPARFTLTLVATFAVIALVLAVVGLYGVLAYAVKQRTAEIGVRMAFGARASTILRLVVGQGLLLSGIGTVVGMLGALALTRVLASMLVGVSATDTRTYVAIAALFLVVATAASLVPALRAARVQPMRALREE